MRPSFRQRRLIAAFLLVAGTAISVAGRERPAADPDRTEWFRNAKFGLFIHWGPYAMIGREEWARQLLRIPHAEYQKIASGFNPVHFDPDAWVRLAAEAGARYIVITAKHHDGFCLFDSAHTTNTIMNTPYGRDILAGLAAACRRNGMPLGLYYSIMDWHHPDYLPRRDWETDRPAGNADFNRYIDFAQAQVRELIEKYDPAILWFDGEWEHSNEDQRADEFERMILDLNPNILINDRLFRREPGRGDFGTPENFVPATGWRHEDGTPRLWEACATINYNGWGYNRYETEFHSAPQIIRKLAEIAGKGGNLLLNIGPAPDGTIQPEFVSRLKSVGEWLKKNGPAVYDTGPGVFERLPFFGSSTVKDNTAYIHIMGRPPDNRIRLPGLRSYLKKVAMLDKPEKNLNFRRLRNDIVVSLPSPLPDPDVSVLVLEFQGEPRIDPYEIEPDNTGRIELPVYLADLQSRMGQRAYLDDFFGRVMLANWQNINDYPEWTFNLKRGGHYEIQASYASQWGGRSSFVVEINDEIRIPGTSGDSPSIYYPATFSLGTARLDPGRHTLRFRITCVVNNNALKLENVVLVPLSR